MITLRTLRLRLRSAQDGIAMIMVLGVAGVMTLLVISALALSMGTLNKADNDDDWNGALAAAFAGLEEYQSRLAEEPGYVQYGNPAAAFSLTSPVHLPPTSKTNKAFGIGVNGTWADGTDDADNVLFKYRYEVDNSAYSSTGTIRLRATGLVGTQTRSVVADVRQTGFIDYVYFTDYEMADPAVSLSSCPINQHTWEGRPASVNGIACTIQFQAADVLSGSVHSNDTFQICGATFSNVVTTGRPGGGFVKPSGCTPNPVWGVGPPLYSPSIAMPATNTELIKETRSDIPDVVPRPGCLYTGPTQITFISGGRMTVKSPWTKFTNISGDPTAPTAGNNTNSAQCGTISALTGTSGATVSVPQNNVIYVQNIPLTGINGAATTLTATTGTGARCKTLAQATIPATANGYSQNVVGFPQNTEFIESPMLAGPGVTASYGCRNGDLFISGTNSGGAVTLAAQNFVYVTGDLRYANVDTDMIGLVGQNAVWVYNPMTTANGNFILGSNRRIDAAILSVAHTFQVQNQDQGSSGRGTLTLYGSIAQKFRGTVGLANGNAGYLKDYRYDPRYRYTAPPKFLSPVTTTYGINVWIEIRPVFKTDGSCVLKPNNTCL